MVKKDITFTFNGFSYSKFSSRYIMVPGRSWRGSANSKHLVVLRLPPMSQNPTLLRGSEGHPQPQCMMISHNIVRERNNSEQDEIVIRKLNE